MPEIKIKKTSQSPNNKQRVGQSLLFGIIVLMKSQRLGNLIPDDLTFLKQKASLSFVIEKAQ